MSQDFHRNGLVVCMFALLDRRVMAERPNKRYACDKPEDNPAAPCDNPQIRESAPNPLPTASPTKASTMMRGTPSAQPAHVARTH